MTNSSESAIESPAILSEVSPAVLPRAILVENDRSFSWITEKICGIIEGKTPAWWWWCFGRFDGLECWGVLCVLSVVFAVSVDVRRLCLLF